MTTAEEIRTYLARHLYSSFPRSVSGSEVDVTVFPGKSTKVQIEIPEDFEKQLRELLKSGNWHYIESQHLRGIEVLEILRSRDLALQVLE